MDDWRIQIFSSVNLNYSVIQTFTQHFIVFILHGSCVLWRFGLHLYFLSYCQTQYDKTNNVSIFWNYLVLICKAEILYLPPCYLNHYIFLSHPKWFILQTHSLWPQRHLWFGENIWVKVYISLHIWLSVVASDLFNCEHCTRHPTSHCSQFSLLRL